MCIPSREIVPIGMIFPLSSLERLWGLKEDRCGPCLCFLVRSLVMQADTGQLLIIARSDSALLQALIVLRRGIVNLKNYLDELSPLNLHLRPFRGHSSRSFWDGAPFSLQIHYNKLINYCQVDNT